LRPWKRACPFAKLQDLIDPLFLDALPRAEGLPLTPANLERVGRHTSPEASRWAFGQWELRARARAKFRRAAEMLFVREALEQATHEDLATYHAAKFPPGALVWDLTCGIGADAIALAARGPVRAFDLDGERVDYARHNLAVHGQAAETEVADSLGVVGSPDYVFADPARRVEGRRTLKLEEFSPSPEAIRDRFPNVRLGVIKLSPMLADADLEGIGPGLEFLSFDRECREALILFGRDAPSGRWAVHVASGERVPAGEGLERAAGTPSGAMDYLFDADPALVRAHGLGAVAQRHGLLALGDVPGYLTGPELCTSVWLRPYRVLYDGKGDPKSTRAALRRLGSSTPELKQRGAGLDLIAERKRYAMDGERALSLVIWRLGPRLHHTICEPA
jgi:hypothetical protein